MDDEIERVIESIVKAVEPDPYRRRSAPYSERDLVDGFTDIDCRRVAHCAEPPRLARPMVLVPERPRAFTGCGSRACALQRRGDAAAEA
jgi:hypothetical protein